MSRTYLIVFPLSAAFVSFFFLFVPLTSRATQTPRMSLDWGTADDTYNEATNSMTIGSIDNCLTTPPPGNNDQHIHPAYLIVQGVEDMIGWQARLNYDGGKMRPMSVNTAPFADSGRGQSVAFPNLPIDPTTGVHRDLINASHIPPAAPGPQTAAMGALYAGAQSEPISPDSPPKIPPDDTSYGAPDGGILATIAIQVLQGQAGQPLLTMDLDDGDPNPPGSGLSVFTSQGLKSIYLDESALFDAYHAEGSTCVPPVIVPPLPATAGGQGQPGGPGAPAASAAPGSSPGASASAGATPRPGETTGTASPSTTSSSGDNHNAGGGSSGGNDGGTPTWVYVLLAAAAVAVLAAGFAAWRYRSRLPWFRGG
jgi:hypothetical protein